MYTSQQAFIDRNSIVDQTAGDEYGGRARHCTVVGENQFEHVVVDLAAGGDQRCRQNYSFLIDLAVDSQTRGLRAAYINMVRHVSHIAKSLPAGVDRCDDGDIIEMTRPAMRVVDEDRIPGLEFLLAVFLDRVRRNHTHGNEMRWLGEGLRDAAQLSVEERT